MAEITVQECEEYVQKHQVQALLKTAIEALCKERPDNPVRFLKEYFESLDKDKKVSAVELYLFHITGLIIEVCCHCR